MAVSNVAASATDVTVLAANGSRGSASVFNDSTATLYLLCENATSTTSKCTVVMPAGGYFDVPFGYRGVLKGIWSSADGGFARVTEN